MTDVIAGFARIQATASFRQRFAFLASDLTKLANRHELAPDAK